ncbi:hypothetical protein GCM10017655_49810 [Pseudomonas turukhanskensis]|uniref:Lipoprotein n=2 Tax=Pseudomonas turukhanskensis TaxID=1806536 RepID=A0A9W6NIH4_9PSED|nr:hypothetical protein GCM10017655_49810 [Pseudomonas turukhanskensis]
MNNLKASLLAVTVFACAAAQGQVLQRELGDYDLQLGTTPTRSMAQGLVQPSQSGTFQGGLDLTHDSGWYLGQWSPSMGIARDSQLELDSYSGFKRPFNNRFGYEMGLIRYSHPGFSANDSNEYYAGLTLLDSRFGAAFSQAPGRTDSTLLMSLALAPVKMNVSMKYANHALDDAVSYDDVRSVRMFNDWSLNLSRPWAGIDLNLSYSGSSLSGSQCVAYSGHNGYCEDYVMFKAERSLF